MRREIPWLDTEKNGVFYVFWYDGETKRVKRLSLGTKEAGQAQRRYAAFLIERSREAEAGPATAAQATLTCGMALDDYRREHVEARAKLAKHHPTVFHLAHLDAHFGPVPVRDVDPALVRAYLTRRAAGTVGRPAAEATVARELTVLVAAFNHAVRERRLAAGDVPAITRPPQAEAKDRWLTHEELAKLFAAALGEAPNRLPRIYRFIALAYYTASRKGALQGLTWFQVDLERSKIRLNPEGRAQTKKRRPVVPVDSDLAPILARAKAEKTNELVLDETGSIRTAFEAAVERAGLAPPLPEGATAAQRAAHRRQAVTPHTLRHTRAVHLAQAGTDLWVIAGLLGDTIATVEKNYLHHCPDHIRLQLEAAKARTPGETSGATPQAV